MKFPYELMEVKEQCSVEGITYFMVQTKSSRDGWEAADIRPDIPNQRKVAELLAAAPDLLEALERILEQPLTGNPSHKSLIEHWEYERSLGNGYAKDQLFALSAIAKAKGE